ncbi:MAG: HAD family hydrolase [Erysipelotrichaceae bacterium]|nr:HAD family hydrolase [Erysipelotrichaceae bacterium]
MEKMFFFDIDDTLYDLAEPFCKTCDAFFKGDLVLPMDELFLAFRRHGEVSFTAVENGRMTMAEMYCYRLQKAFGEFGTGLSDEEALAFQKAYQKNQYHIVLSEDMRTFFNEFSKDTVFGVLSNGPSEHQWDKVKSLGLLQWIKKENIIISGDVGVVKPNERIFRIAEEKAEDKEPWMIGDSFESDITGAHNVGWRSVWINRRRRVAKDKNIVPDYTVYSEKEIIDTLKQIIKGQ